MDTKNTFDVLQLIQVDCTFTIKNKKELLRIMKELNFEMKIESENGFFYSFIGSINNISYELCFCSMFSSIAFFLSDKNIGFLKEKDGRKWIQNHSFNNLPSKYEYDYELELKAYAHFNEGVICNKNNTIMEFFKKDIKKIYRYSISKFSLNTELIIIENNIISNGVFNFLGKKILFNELLTRIPKIKKFNLIDYENIHLKLNQDEIDLLHILYN